MHKTCFGKLTSTHNIVFLLVVQCTPTSNPLPLRIVELENAFVADDKGSFSFIGFKILLCKCTIRAFEKHVVSGKIEFYASTKTHSGCSLKAGLLLCFQLARTAQQATLTLRYKEQPNRLVTHKCQSTVPQRLGTLDTFDQSDDLN